MNRVINRGNFIAGSAITAAAAAVVRDPASAAGIPGGTHAVERQADFDSAQFGDAVGRPARIRQVFEAVALRPAVLGSIKNSLNGLQFGFGYAPGDITIALAGHGPSSAYGMTDTIWSKYRIGEFAKAVDASGAAVRSNVYLRSRAPFDATADPDDAAAMYQDTSIEMLQRRGVIVLTCHTAIEELARGLVKGGFAPAGSRAADVASDILTHLIPGAIVVPSMVATLAVLQTNFHYAYISQQA